MEGLEEYVQTSLPEDEATIQELTDSIQETLDLFTHIEFESEVKGPEAEQRLPTLWPYWILDNDRRKFRDLEKNDARPESRLSQSTTAMIVAAIGAATSTPVNRSSSGYQWGNTIESRPFKLSEVLQSNLETATENLAKQWRDPKKLTPSDPNENKDCSLSGTFGRDDILTLSWHLDIFSPDSTPICKAAASGVDVYRQTEKIVLDRIIAYAESTSGYAGVIGAFNYQASDKGRHAKSTPGHAGAIGASQESDKGRIVLDSAYNLLRFIRCIPRIVGALKDITEEQSTAITRAKDRAFYRFRSRLHEQLSFSSIEDSHFDGSELAFCLEGMVQLRPDSVNGALLKRVMQVMEKAQSSAPSWSSDMPIVADHRGRVLYPASVEIARSLLSSISIFDLHNSRNSLYHSAGATYLDLIKRYWVWLKTRRTSIIIAEKEKEKVKVAGWHSEHLNDTAVIHTWETSQILEFCIAFRDQMLRYVGRKLLAASRLKVEWPMPDLKGWPAIVAQYEPVDSLGGDYSVYADIGKKLVEKHKRHAQKEAMWSALVYGPPGTGKTELASNIAGVLGVPLITVTVSDFMADGEGRMETRAKLLFDVLERQTFSVVLFDELDQFLLDRNSKRFHDQDSVFQFLTPGMLTKLHALRRRASVIFLVATNYEERIDSAVKRAGRIDGSYLLLPPDNARRIIMLSDFDGTKDHMVEIKDKTRIIRASAFLGYNDLQLIANQPWAGEDDLFKRLNEAPRSIHCYSYLTRFEESSEDTVSLFAGPRAELVGLIRLAHQAWDGGPGSWTDVARKHMFGKIFANAIMRDLAEKLDHRSKSALGEELEKLGVPNDIKES